MDIIQEALHQLNKNVNTKNHRRTNRKLVSNRKLKEYATSKTAVREPEKHTRNKLSKLPFDSLWDQVYSSLTDAGENLSYDALGDLKGKGHYDIYDITSKLDIKPGYDGIKIRDNGNPESTSVWDNFEWAEHVADVYNLETAYNRDKTELTIYVPINEIPDKNLIVNADNYKPYGIIEENYAYTLIEVMSLNQLLELQQDTAWDITKERWNNLVGSGAEFYVLLDRKVVENKYLLVIWKAKNYINVYDAANKLYVGDDIVDEVKNNKFTEVFTTWLPKLGIVNGSELDVPEEDESEESEELGELTEDLDESAPITPLGEATARDFIINVREATQHRPPEFFKVGYISDMESKVAAKYKHGRGSENQPSVKIFKCSEATVYTGAPYENLKATKLMRSVTGKERGENRGNFNFNGERCIENRIGHYGNGDRYFLRAYLRKGTFPKVKYFISIDGEEMRETTKQEVARYFTSYAASTLLNGRSEVETPGAEGASVVTYALDQIYKIGNLGNSIF